MAGNTKIKLYEQNDELLMQLICRGDRKAFELLYDRYFDKLAWFARGFIEDRQKAEDAVQEVFMKIIEKPGQFDESRKFSTWVYTVTANCCRQVLRNELNRSRLLNENAGHLYPAYTNILAEYDNSLIKERIKTACASLNEKEKNIYTLRFEQELSIKEIAGIINIPEGSVKSGIYYLLKKMASYLKEFTHER